MAFVVATHRGIIDLARPCIEPGLEIGPTLGRIEGSCRALHGPQDVGERACGTQGVPHRLRSTLSDDTIRVVARWQGGKAQRPTRPQQGECPFGGTMGGTLAGGITVETDDGFGRQTPKLLNLGLGKGERLSSRRVMIRMSSPLHRSVERSARVRVTPRAHAKA